ncbi:hypothetical protein ScPMuIL_015586 [Solemya velum]
MAKRSRKANYTTAERSAEDLRKMNGLVDTVKGRERPHHGISIMELMEPFESKSNLPKRWWLYICGILPVAFLPYLHIGIIHLYLWVPDKKAVNREDCRCNCFDTVFKGSYESPGNVHYKHVYFNATAQTLKIWILTVCFTIMTEEEVILKKDNFEKI